MNKMDCEYTGDAAEQTPYEVFNAEGKADILLICDHASNTLPPGYADLGLEASLLHRHIAYDIGPADVTRRLAKLIDAPAMLSRYSRLLVDINRQPGNPGWMPVVSDHIAVPGNEDLAEAEITLRRQQYYDPYHAAVTARLGGFSTRDVVPALFSIHSFTPVMDGYERPWQVGLLWNLDDRLARHMVQALSAYPDLMVGENQPYSGSDPSGYSIHVHGEEPGFPCLALEIRQDQIDTHHTAEAWANRLAPAIKQTVRSAGPFVLEPNLEWQGSLDEAT
jgi:predicted N-formylglutamate amidohydrolase